MNIEKQKYFLEKDIERMVNSLKCGDTDFDCWNWKRDEDILNIIAAFHDGESKEGYRNIMKNIRTILIKKHKDEVRSEYRAVEFEGVEYQPLERPRYMYYTDWEGLQSLAVRAGDGIDEQKYIIYWDSNNPKSHFGYVIDWDNPSNVELWN